MDRLNAVLEALHFRFDVGCGTCDGCEKLPECASLDVSAFELLQEYVDRCARYADEVMALRERVKQGMRGDKYYEIWALWAFCKHQDVPAEIVPLFDGWKLVFPNGDDFVQHEFSYMGDSGALEPAIGCEDDFSPVMLNEAKVLVLKHRQRLAVPRVALPETKEGEE